MSEHKIEVWQFHDGTFRALDVITDVRAVGDTAWDALYNLTLNLGMGEGEVTPVAEFVS